MNIVEIFDTMPEESNIGQLRAEFIHLSEDPLFGMLPAQEVSYNAFREILRDLVATSPTISSLYYTYQNTSMESLPRKLVGELLEVIEEGKMVDLVNEDAETSSRRLQEVVEAVEQVKGNIQFYDLLGKLAEKPTFSDLFTQLGLVMQMKPAEAQS